MARRVRKRPRPYWRILDFAHYLIDFHLVKTNQPLTSALALPLLHLMALDFVNLPLLKPKGYKQ